MECVNTQSPAGVGQLTLFLTTFIKHEKDPPWLNPRPKKQWGSSLLVRGVNLAPIKASVCHLDGQQEAFVYRKTSPWSRLGRSATPQFPRQPNPIQQPWWGPVLQHFSALNKAAKAQSQAETNNRDVKTLKYVLRQILQYISLTDWYVLFKAAVYWVPDISLMVREPPLLQKRSTAQLGRKPTNYIQEETYTG